MVHELFGPRFAKLYVRADGVYAGSLSDSSLEPQAVSMAHEAIAEGNSYISAPQGRRMMVEALGAPSRLLICGAGHDADPVAQYAAELGFEVVVSDEREGLLTPERFPSAHLVPAPASRLGSKISLDRRTYVVVMSHNYLRDLDYLRSVLGSDVPYIGALGPGAQPGAAHNRPGGSPDHRRRPMTSPRCTGPPAWTSAQKDPRRSRGRSWRRYWLSGVAKQAATCGTAKVRYHLGETDCLRTCQILLTGTGSGSRGASHEDRT